MKTNRLFPTPRHRNWLLAALCGVALPGLLLAQDLPFSSGSTGADGPLRFREIPTIGRQQLAMAYDAARQRVVLFGGLSPGALDDTWLWNGANWLRALPATRPLPRSGHRMVYDAARQEVVLFGGNRLGTRVNETWVWDGTTWTQKNPATSPPARENFGMAYDAARQQVVVFGGTGSTDDTWLWDGTTWTAAAPVTRPPQQSSVRLEYDAARQEVLMFGNAGQTWAWNGTAWANKSPVVSPPARNGTELVYDPIRQEILLVGGSSARDTWGWNGTIWSQKSPLGHPPGRQHHGLAWDGALQRVLLFGGDSTADNYDADTWLWDGTTWTFWSGKTQYFDMAARASGIWNFTTIDIPGGVTVRFLKNAGNTPVRWLATDQVTINGAVDVSGAAGAAALPLGAVAVGGPGGYDGGRGGIRFDSSASYVGTPGQGPGGGSPGTSPQTSPTNLRDAQPGEHQGAYGNAFLQPLLGGSGGGGGSSSDTANGGNGGGGGGAILIASSRDITVNGVIRANGGAREFIASYGGTGAGGSILLRADRVAGPGSLEAYGGTTSNPNGRIRIEAYNRTLGGSINPVGVVGLPSASGELNQVGTLRVVSINGIAVPTPPSGNLSAPDVVFNNAGPIAIVVSGTGIPDNSPITVRITTANTVISAGPQPMVGGNATLTATVPRGAGTVQATAQFTTGG